MTIVYQFEESLYVNLTNKCPCACVFCIRKNQDSVGECDSLWLDHEPQLQEVIEDFSKYTFENYKEVVFCGYGEPLERIDLLLEVCKHIREKSMLPIRVNTNGLSDLIHGKKTAHLLVGYVDKIAISLNAPNKDAYMRVAKPKFGEESFQSLLGFAKDAKLNGIEVSFSIVDIISPEEIEACKQLAEEMSIPLRIRTMIE